jgi:hypothetical protein
MKNKSLLTLLVAFIVSFALGGFLAQAAGIPNVALPLGTALFATTFIPKNVAAGSLLMALPTIDISEIITEFGNYYRAGSQAVKDLRVKLMQPLETEAFFTPRLTTSTRIELGNASITRVLQAYQKNFTPIGDTKFTPQIIDLDHIKIDVSIVPHDVMESWLGYLAENGLKPQDCPLVKYWLEMLVIPKSREDLELFEIFHGKKGAIVVDTPSPQGETMNGIKEKLKGAGIQVVAMGAVPSDPVLFVEYVETYFASIPEIIRNNIKRIAMNKTLELRFKQGKRKKYNQYYAQDTDLLKLADFDASVVGLASHVGHNVIWSTVEDNKIIGNKNPQNATVFNIQPFDRQVKGLTDFHKGVGFWANNLVYRTDIPLT